MNRINFIKKIFFPLLLTIVVLASIIIVINKDKVNYKCSECNVILISIDTLRANLLSCYGYDKMTSPNIDQFSEDSVLFRKCIAQAPSTLASHATIFTSLIPSHHQASFARMTALPKEIRTIAEILKAKGYKTISFNDGGQLAPNFGLDQGFDVYRSTNEKKATLYFSDIVKKSINWIVRNSEKKFFLFLHTYETHSPYTPKKKYLDLFEENYSGSLPMHTSDRVAQRINNGRIKITSEDTLHIINTYNAEIRSMDESFGIFIDFLKKKELYDKTIIIFTSDHGEEFNDHGVMASHSHTLFDELLHIPLIIKFANSKFASREIKNLIRSIDIMPTLLDMANLKIPENLEGISLMPMIKGRSMNEDLFAISERDMIETLQDECWSIMYDNWKLYNSRLYDLEKDPFERIDVSSDHGELKTLLRKKGIQFIKQNRISQQREKVKLDKTELEKLKALGYIK